MTEEYGRKVPYFGLYPSDKIQVHADSLLNLIFLIKRSQNEKKNHSIPLSAGWA